MIHLVILTNLVEGFRNLPLGVCKEDISILMGTSFGCRERVCGLIDEDSYQDSDTKSQTVVPIPRPILQSPKNSFNISESESGSTTCRKSSYSARCLLRSDSISASQCIGVEGADFC